MLLIKEATTMNALNWFEIPVSNIDRAQKFYQGLLGQDLKRENFGGQAHAVFPAKEPGVSGALVEMKERKPAGEGTLVYLNVEGKLDGCLTRVASSGGAV